MVLIFDFSKSNESTSLCLNLKAKKSEEIIKIKEKINNGVSK
jgi:hypothetical protein